MINRKFVRAQCERECGYVLLQFCTKIGVTLYCFDKTARTGLERTPNKSRTSARSPLWRRKFFRRSCRDPTRNLSITSPALYQQFIPAKVVPIPLSLSLRADMRACVCEHVCVRARERTLVYVFSSNTSFNVTVYVFSDSAAGTSVCLCTFSDQVRPLT